MQVGGNGNQLWGRGNSVLSAKIQNCSGQQHINKRFGGVSADDKKGCGGACASGAECTGALHVLTAFMGFDISVMNMGLLCKAVLGNP